QMTATAATEWMPGSSPGMTTLEMEWRPAWRTSSMRHCGGAVLGDEGAGREALERERRGDGVRLVTRDEVGEGVAGPRRRLPAAGAPAAVDVEAFHRCLREDRARVRADVHDTAPLPHHAEPRH